MQFLILKMCNVKMQPCDLKTIENVKQNQEKCLSKTEI